MKCVRGVSRVIEDATLATSYCMPPVDVNMINDRAVESYQSRFMLDCFVDGADPFKRIAEWSNCKRDDIPRQITLARVLVDAERFDGLDSLTWRDRVGRHCPRGEIYARSVDFSEHDAVLWNGLRGIWKVVRPLADAEAMCEMFKVVKVSDGPSRRFRWQWESLEAGRATSLEAACFASTAIAMKGGQAVILRAADEDYSVLFCLGDTTYMIALPQWRLHRLEEIDLTAMEKLTTEKSYIFVLPLSCCA